MEIIKRVSNVHTAAYPGRPVIYLAIHYTAGTTSKKGTARNVAAMFGNSSSRAASADFIVDDAEIVQFNPDIKGRYCYAVGGARQTKYGADFFGKAKNYNTISIEICSGNTTGKVVNEYNHPSWFFTDAAVNNAVKLARFLVKTYGIKPGNIIRHFDVNGKVCPNIIGWTTYGGASDYKWQAFKAAVISGAEPEKEAEEMDVEKFVNECTNEQAYKLLAKARAYLKEQQQDAWPDLESAAAFGITDGKRPQDLCTRAEAAVMAYRGMKRGMEK